MLLRGQAITFEAVSWMTSDLELFSAMQLQAIIICSLSKNKKILKELFSKKNKKCRRNSCLQGNGSWDVHPKSLLQCILESDTELSTDIPVCGLLCPSLLSRNIFTYIWQVENIRAYLQALIL